MQINDVRTYVLLKPFEPAPCIASGAIRHRNLRAVARLNLQMHDDFLTVHFRLHENVGAIGFDSQLLVLNHFHELRVRDAKRKAEPVFGIFLNQLL